MINFLLKLLLLSEILSNSRTENGIKLANSSIFYLLKIIRLISYLDCFFFELDLLEASKTRPRLLAANDVILNEQAFSIAF